MTTKAKSKQGFASLTPEQRRAIASKGGRAAHANGTAHKFIAGSEEAREAGRRGGESKRKKREQGG